ncbi:asparagine synthetase [Paenibacillus mucilaginosus 3016]|uniref:asparagine synthase (glutamine-hydrolyzing) n=1 Tax=Paenibacillus mucilaginosus 3016 TaxID=1116391 RepID=H6N945_9BACL|nr:asparagine synthase (glutamine-hydrolyzing) [Paenibacillus mucilaginosus]AFC27791.1 asparagine synthetase [Paenibacillus mucilaginosus 3016]WFA16664.1 asparagine synthase (glutamine-hydrolyzing) [Paenibacillus mucilaginosus]
MCGIAGFCTSDANQARPEILQAMIEEIHHRGPDNHGIRFYPGDRQEVIGLGHKRLSIIDLSDNGKQPMASVSGNTSIVFNGEIYNYHTIRRELEAEGWTFRTGTDTEVILNLYEKYGEGCLRHLNGMFAFAIYDHRKKQLFIARDRFGVRPLYYSLRGGKGLAFASELKALWKFPGVKKEVRFGALYQYARKRYVDHPDTIFEGIEKLKPGHYLIYKEGKAELKEYWDIDNFEELPLSFDDAVEELDALLLDSIRLRMISDVPVGAFLSGGLDSSLIVAMMAKYSALPIKTYSVGFEDERYSELGFARQVAERFGTDHTELKVSASDFAQHLYQAVTYRDAPLSESADVPMYMLSRMAKKDVSVILTGEGSDELFAGYPKYAYDRFAKAPWFRGLLKNPLAAAAINALPYSARKAKLAYHTLCIDDDRQRYDRWFSSIGEEAARTLFTREFQEQYLGSREERQPSVLKGTTNMNRMQYQDVKYWLSDNLLERGDRMVMAASVEGRLPFLDYRVGEFAFRLPEHYRIRGMERKYIVKKLAERYLPKELIYRKKIGFYVPVGDWFRNELKDFVGEHLLSDTFRSRGIFEAGKVEEMFSAHSRGTVNYEKELWTLLNLEIWFRACID